MDTSVTLANWRTAPYSSQSFQNVDKLIPVSRIEGPEKAWEFAAELQSLESLVFEDQHGQERKLPAPQSISHLHGMPELGEAERARLALRSSLASREGFVGIKQSGPPPIRSCRPASSSAFLTS